MRLFAVLRIPILLLGALSAVALDRTLRVPLAPPAPAPASPRVIMAPSAFLAPAPLPAAFPERDLLPAVPDLLENVAPGVVSVYALRTTPRRDGALSPFGSSADPAPPEPNLGSGIVVRGDGLIVTNHHVVEGAEELKVVLWDRREFRATLLGQDTHTDLALLRIAAEGLQPVRFGDSDSVRIGEPVLAMGNALGLGQTVSSGIIGARGRSGMGIADEEDFFQTDASMNPGSSGGPLLNRQGEVIGIITAIATRTGGFQGIGFVIPSRLVEEITYRLLRDGKIVRGSLGVSVQELTPPLAEAFGLERTPGLIITGVCPQAAGSRAGLERGDVLTTVEGMPVASRYELEHRIAMLGARAKVRVGIWRQGKSETLSAQLDGVQDPPAPPPDAPAADDPRGEPSGLEGVTVRRVDPESLKQAGIQDEEGGLLITGLRGAGVVAGLEKGDLIVEVNGRTVHDVDDVRSELCLEGSMVLVRVRRADGSHYLMAPY